MSSYRRYFDNTKCVSFLIKDEKLLKKYNEIWKKISYIIKQRILQHTCIHWKACKN